MSADRPNFAEIGNIRVISVEEAARISTLLRENGKTVGLITGCFDILHVGHLDLFRFAKENVDLLMIGVEQDETLRNSKGTNRPVVSLQDRCEMLLGLREVDFVFPVPFTIQYHPSPEIDAMYGELYRKIHPDYLITNLAADKFSGTKKRRAKILGIGFLGKKTQKQTSSTEIINRMRKGL